MKNVKLFLSGFAVFVIVGTALAFKTTGIFGKGSVYCKNTCASSSRADFTLNPDGSFTAPCGRTVGVPNPSYIYNTEGKCVQVKAGAKFSPTGAGQ